MEIKEIEALFDRFENSSIDEMEVQAGDYRLFLKRNSNRELVEVKPQTVAKTKVTNEEKDDSLKIKAPLVGTFYRASAPGAEPYINVGDQVKAGDVIGLIEAMKFMNEITATSDGVVADIPAKDGEFVAFDETLVVLK